MRFAVNWMEKWANNPTFDMFGVTHEELDRPTGPWENKEGLHRRDGPVLVDFFFKDPSGKPDRGMAGAGINGTYHDGTEFSFCGYWSSRAGCVNRLWPDRPVLDIVVSYYSCHIHAATLIDWWKEARPDWGLVWADMHGDGEFILQPTRNGKLKNKPKGEIREV